MACRRVGGAKGELAEKSTFIKLDRNIINWRWFKDHKTYKLFTYLLLTANTTDHPFEGIIVHRGQLVSSLANLACETGLTIKEVRTALNHLKRTQEVAYLSSPKYGLITVLNYDRYQSGAYTSARKGHAIGTPGAHDGQQYNNGNNDNNEKNSARASTSDEWTPPPKGTPEYERWRNQ